MSGSRWDQPGVPHKGWHCVDVVDLRANGERADDTDYATCQMCGNEKIRYVHIMEHPDVEEAWGPIRADRHGRTLALLRRSCHGVFDCFLRCAAELAPIHDSQGEFDGAFALLESRIEAVDLERCQVDRWRHQRRTAKKARKDVASQRRHARTLFGPFLLS